MLTNIAIGIVTMAVCLSLQALLLLLALRHYVRRERLVRTSSFLPTVWVLSGVLVFLVVGILAQVGIWAALFGLLGEFPEYATAFYHSAVNFATLGYGDIVMSERYKLLGALEAINGVLMVGVATAVLMTTFQDAVRQTIRARQAAGVALLEEPID